MEKFKFEILGITTSHSNIGSYTLVLEETGGKRRLPIVIGGVEAQAIMLEIEKIKPHRPMTHDLMFNICDTFGVDLIEIDIVEVKEAVFFARMKFSKGGEEKEIDARPSDAIALAVRFNVPIYVFDSVVQEAGIDMRNDSTSPADTVINPPPQVPSVPDKAPEPSKAEKLAILKKKMEEAIHNEDYEKAAALRDQINQLENL